MDNKEKDMIVNNPSDVIPCDSPGTSFDFKALEKELEADLTAHLSDIQLLEEQKAAIGNPESLGKTIMNVIWAQCINQIGTVAGEDFIRENHDMPLDLRYEAHIQTEKNFVNKKFPDHNKEQLNNQKYSVRYEKWQDSFERNDNGTIKTHSDRAGVRSNVKKDVRKPYDAGRPHGSKSNNTAMDHTVPVAEIIRDPAMAAYMDEKDRINFANSSENLQELRADWNQSKKDLTMHDWLEKTNSNGQTPEEIWNEMDEKQKEELFERDKIARRKMEEDKQKAKNEAIREGRQSQMEEALRVGGKAVRAAIMGLLAQLVRKIIGKLIAWFKSKNKNLEALINNIKTAVIEFFSDVKSIIMVSVDTVATTIIVSAVGDFLRKVWVVIKQAGRSLIEAIQYLKNPENRKKSVGILTLEVGKIITAGLTAAGAILLGEVIEKALMGIPGFAIPIPLIGSLASIIGMFLSGIVMGIIGALLMSLIDTLIAKAQKQEITKLQIDKNNDIIATQEKMIFVKRRSSEIARESLLEELEARHAKASFIINEALDNIFGPAGLPEET